MADAVVSVVVEQIAALLKEQATYHVNLVRGAETEVENLADELKMVRNVLDDAERRGNEDKGIKDWLLRLEQTSYEMEDVLDEWNYAFLKLRIEGDQFAAKKKPVAEVSHNSLRDPSTSFADLEAVCGRDSDRNAIVTKLIHREEELGIQVVSIVGVGGLGKTTLAQLVYNDGRVVNFFALRIWICVSNPFDLVAIAKGILESMGRGSSANTTELDVLLRNVEESISGKRFLLVLDDVWTEDYKKWEPLRISLRFGGKGSKVLGTTRNEKVAKAMGTIEIDIHRLQLLSPEDCWSLLCRISLSGRSEEECERFHDIGKKIASKCKGLPLAACVLGSLLQSKSSLEEWESVFKSETWELEEAEEQIFPHLLLSYNQLSPALQRCFFYCAIFPKDFEFDVDQLIENWIVQGYLGSDVGNIRDMELKGREYFQNLVMRSLFQDLKRGNFDDKIISCKMHDVVHDFAQSLRRDRSTVEARMKKTACQRCSSSLVSSVKMYRSLLSYDHRYICDCLTSVRVLGIENHSWNGIPPGTKHLIHLRWLDLSRNNFSMEDMKIICYLYNLHFLWLEDCKLEEVPSEIGNLIQLRHLNLSCNKQLKELPKKIGNLIQLRQLDLRLNKSLKELPEEIGNLIQLKHLDLIGTESLKELPESIYGLINLKHIFTDSITPKLFSQGVSKLTDLRTLSTFWGGRGWGKLGWLKDLKLLSGNLQLLIADSEDMVADARQADLRNKMHLHTLHIGWRMGNGNEEENDLVRMNVMDALEPHRNLQNLKISGYKGSKISGWITSPLFHLRSIKLSRLICLQSLPPLGKLPCLEEIHICYMEELQLVGREFLGIAAAGASSSNTTSTIVVFPKLEKLNFRGCGKWKEWEDITAEEDDSASITFMPCLTELIIKNCNYLTALPDRLLGKALSLEYVQIEALSPGELFKRYKDREGATTTHKHMIYAWKLEVPLGPK